MAVPVALVIRGEARPQTLAVQSACAGPLPGREDSHEVGGVEGACRSYLERAEPQMGRLGVVGDHLPCPPGDRVEGPAGDMDTQAMRRDAQAPSKGPPSGSGTAEGPPAGSAPSRHPDPTVHALMVRRLSSRLALWVGAAWGFAEAFLFFIVPDAWLGFVALYAPRRMAATLLAIIGGAVGGAVVLYLATPLLGESLTVVIVALPGLSPDDLDQVRADLADQGPIAFLTGIVLALPVKLYVHASALDGIGLPEVIVFTVANRIERLLVFGLVMALLGWLGRPVVARWPLASAVVYVAGWVIFYAGYWRATAA